MPAPRKACHCWRCCSLAGTGRAGVQVRAPHYRRVQKRTGAAARLWTPSQLQNCRQEGGIKTTSTSCGTGWRVKEGHQLDTSDLMPLKSALAASTKLCRRSKSDLNRPRSRMTSCDDSGDLSLLSSSSSTAFDPPADFRGVPRWRPLFAFPCKDR